MAKMFEDLKGQFCHNKGGKLGLGSMLSKASLTSSWTFALIEMEGYSGFLNKGFT